MEKLIKAFRALDFIGAVAVLAWAYHVHSWLWAAGGVLGLVMAWYAPAQRLSGAVQRRFIGKRPPAASMPLPSSSPETAPVLPPAVANYKQGWTDHWQVTPPQAAKDFAAQASHPRFTGDARK